MFLIITILLFTSTPAIYNFLWKAIQRGEMFGAWQDVVEWVFGKGWHKVSDFIGGCQVCFAHFIAWLAYITWATICGEWYVWLLWTAMVPMLWLVNLYSKHILDILTEKSEIYRLKKEEAQARLDAIEREELLKKTEL